MIETIFVIFVYCFSFTVSIGLTIYSIFYIYGDIKGAPYVPTKQKMVTEIVDYIKLKKGQKFYELGSGDGRVVMAIAKAYQVKAVGVEIHPMLVLYSKFVAKLRNINNVEFITADFFKVNLKDADILFLFLLPRALKKLREKILKECKKGTVIISHGFKIEGFESKLIDTYKRPIFSTFIYKL